MNDTTGFSLMPADCLYRGLAIDPQAIAAIDGQRQLSYQALTDQVERFALALREQCPQGSVVGLCAQNNLEHLIAYLAILVGGFVWVPINPKNGETLNRQLIETAQPALILVDENSEDSLPPLTVKSWKLDGKDDNISHHSQAFYNQEFSPHQADGSDIMAIKFTGGTTGAPKGVVQTHNNVAAVIDNMQAVFQFNRQDRNLAVAPLTHGGSHYVLPILANGGCHLLVSAPTPEKIVHAFQQQRASVSFMPPTLIYKLIEHPNISSDDFPHLRHLTYSAAPMPPERIQQVQALIGPRLSTVYGQTEAPMTITALTANELANPDLQESVGKACRHSEVSILDQQGCQVTQGETGEIAVRGAIVMPGYFNAAQKTESVFQQQWLLTGDLGYLDDNGYLFIKGRSKELIISGGFNVYPAEVENVLSEHPSITECAVFGVADDYWGERVEAAFCSNDDNLDHQQLNDFLKQRLGAVKTPKAFHRLDQLPRNPVGKVVRRDIQQLIAGIDAANQKNNV